MRAFPVHVQCSDSGPGTTIGYIVRAPVHGLLTPGTSDGRRGEGTNLRAARRPDHDRRELPPGQGVDPQAGAWLMAPLTVFPSVALSSHL